MEFCVISPTAGLEKYAVLSKTHLVLTPVYLKDKTYAEFYNKRRDAGDFIILDNGAYEGETMFHLDIMARLRPQVVVLPDFLLQPWRKTWHAAIAFLDLVYDRDWATGVEFLYIPQSLPGDLHGFIESYQEAVSDRRITWLGIPRAMAYAITDNLLARVEFARMVHRDHPGLKLHAFGMVNGDIHELPYLAQAGVTSIDSSAPVWRGWHARSLTKPEDRKWWDEQGTAVDFNAQVWSNQYKVTIEQEIPGNFSILQNLEACGVNTNLSKS